MIVWQDVVNISPELSTFPAGSQPVIIALAYAQLDSAGWATLLDQAAALMAAHLATVLGRKGKPGAPTGYRVGSVSSSWASLNTAPSMLNATAPGQVLRQLINAQPLFRAGVGRRS